MAERKLLFEEYIDYLLDSLYENTPTGMKNTGSFKVGSIETHRTGIPQYDYLCALVCNETYKDPNDRLDKLPNELFIDQRYNTERTVIYKSAPTYDNRVIIGIRGTDSSSLLDLSTDFLILIGQERASIRGSIQENFILKAVEELQNEGYNMDQSYITGHSLAGLLCCYVGYSIGGINIRAFNTGASPIKHIKKYEINPQAQLIFDNPRLINYYMKGDPLSMYSSSFIKHSFQIVPYKKPSSAIEAHSIHFLLEVCSPTPLFPEMFRIPRRQTQNII